MTTEHSTLLQHWQLKLLLQCWKYWTNCCDVEGIWELRSRVFRMP